MVGWVTKAHLYLSQSPALSVQQKTAAICEFVCVCVCDREADRQRVGEFACHLSANGNHAYDACVCVCVCVYLYAYARIYMEIQTRNIDHQLHRSWAKKAGGREEDARAERAAGSGRVYFCL